MNDLIEALSIMLKYGNPQSPTHCEHDVLQIHLDIDPKKVSDEDRARLDELGFFVSNEGGDQHFRSFRYGSC